MTRTFYCPRCTTDKPLADVKFRKDERGRNRRVCTDCLAYIEELESRNASVCNERDALKRELKERIGL